MRVLDKCPFRITRCAACKTFRRPAAQRLRTAAAAGMARSSRPQTYSQEPSFPQKLINPCLDEQGSPAHMPRAGRRPARSRSGRRTQRLIAGGPHFCAWPGRPQARRAKAPAVLRGLAPGRTSGCRGRADGWGDGAIARLHALPARAAAGRLDAPRRRRSTLRRSSGGPGMRDAVRCTAASSLRQRRRALVCKRGAALGLQPCRWLPCSSSPCSSL